MFQFGMFSSQIQFLQSNTEHEFSYTIACVINSPSTFTYYLDLSNFILESGLSYFRVLTVSCWSIL